jgi:hypothetical protein
LIKAEAMIVRLSQVLSRCSEYKLASIAVIRLAMKGNVSPYANLMAHYRPDWYHAETGITDLLERYNRERFSTGTHPILVTEGMIPIDGHHRIAYASLKGIAEVSVTVGDRPTGERHVSGDWYASLNLEHWRDEIKNEVLAMLAGA